jgi:hypothetical protein
LQVCLCSYYLEISKSVLLKLHCYCDPYTCTVSCYFCSCVPNLLSWTGYLRTDKVKAQEICFFIMIKTVIFHTISLEHLGINHKII